MARIGLLGETLGRLTIFAKGNLDLRDCLHAFRVGERVVWNGINDVIRSLHPGIVTRVQHELWTRSDALLQPATAAPADLVQRSLPLAPYTPASQFSQALFQSDADAIVLSVQPDLMTALVQHRRDGYLFYPNNLDSWPANDRQWLRLNFEAAGLLDVAASMTNFESIIVRLRARSRAPILIFNCSSVVPGDAIHCHSGLEDILSTRIRRFNLALIELSERTGISIIDVDSIVARGGADRLKYDAVHLTPEGCRLVAEEVVRVLDELDVFSPSEISRCS